MRPLSLFVFLFSIIVSTQSIKKFKSLYQEINGTETLNECIIEFNNNVSIKKGEENFITFTILKDKKITNMI